MCTWRSRSAGHPCGSRARRVRRATGLAFGKPFVYAVVAAPFVRLGRSARGLLLFLNVLLLLAILVMASMFAATRASPTVALVLAAGFVFASILPIYVVWRTSEVLNTALVFAGYFLLAL